MKIVRVYKNSGLAGLFKRGGEKVLRSTGNKLVETANRLLKPPPLSKSDRQLVARNRVFKDKHKGQRCFILANGPSLSRQDISPLKREITFVGNLFWKHQLVGAWQPTYYFLADPLYFDGSDAMGDFFRLLTSRVHSSTFIVRISGAKIIRERGLLPLDNTYYASFHGELGRTPLKDIDLSGHILGPGNVALFSVMAALYMGCSPIYLIGFDHDWLARPRETLHFYEGHGGLENHANFRPDLLASHGYKTMMESQLKLWQAHEALLDFAKRKGASIYNATDGGFLDVYPRINYRDVVQTGSLLPVDKNNGPCSR